MRHIFSPGEGSRGSGAQEARDGWLGAIGRWGLRAVVHRPRGAVPARAVRTVGVQEGATVIIVAVSGSRGGGTVVVQVRRVAVTYYSVVAQHVTAQQLTGGCIPFHFHFHRGTECQVVEVCCCAS